MDKRSMVEQLEARLREKAMSAQREGAAAATEAREGASPDEKRVDSRVAQEYSNLARAQQKRLDRAREDLAALEAFRPAQVKERAAMGAVIEVEDGEEGRTLFLCPVGAGIELTMPGGDGFLTVVTPASPLGRAVLGRKVGESVEVVVEGEPKEWTLTWVG